MTSMLRLALTALLCLTTLSAARADDAAAVAGTTARTEGAKVVAPTPGYDATRMEAVPSYGSTLDVKQSGEPGGYDPVKMEAVPSTRGGSTQAAADEAFLQRVWMGP